MTAGEVLIDRLIDWGVEVIFGLPGDGINSIMEALRTRQEKIRFVQVRHEESAAFAACGYSKFTGKLGVGGGAEVGFMLGGGWGFDVGALYTQIKFDATSPLLPGSTNSLTMSASRSSALRLPASR